MSVEKYSETFAFKATEEMAKSIRSEAAARDIDVSDLIRIIIRFGFSVIRHPSMMSYILEYENLGFNNIKVNSDKRE